MVMIHDRSSRLKNNQKDWSVLIYETLIFDSVGL